MENTDIRLRVAFNAVPLMSPLTGIGQYTKSLLLQFQQIGQVEMLNFYGVGWSSDTRKVGLSPAANKLKLLARRFIPNSYALSRHIQQKNFNSGLRLFNAQLYHEPSFLPYSFEGPTVVTVHDLSWIRHPETQPRERVRAMHRFFEPGLRRAKRIITDSVFVKQELVDEFGVDPAIVTPVHLGVEATFEPMNSTQTRSVLSVIGLRHGAYWLAVGTLEPRKNLQLALEAFLRLPQAERTACPLILVGMKGWKTGPLERALSPLIRSGEVRQLGYLTRQDLATVMAGAKALIYPSIYEGFGLPQ